MQYYIPPTHQSRFLFPSQASSHSHQSLIDGCGEHNRESKGPNRGSRQGDGGRRGNTNGRASVSSLYSAVRKWSRRRRASLPQDDDNDDDESEPESPETRWDQFLKREFVAREGRGSWWGTVMEMMEGGCAELEAGADAESDSDVGDEETDDGGEDMDEGVEEEEDSRDRRDFNLSSASSTNWYVIIVSAAVSSPRSRKLATRSTKGET